MHQVLIGYKQPCYFLARIEACKLLWKSDYLPKMNTTVSQF
ncbi:hypothetical protein J661_0540 [Acinetobacter baumannii 1391434]|nr:hypothetical protein J661_0540 [Acinetobacter baumannii 1391434]